MASTRWSREDERILRTYYQMHGSDWEGWAMLLPERSPTSIREKAKKMNLMKSGPAPAATLRLSDSQVMRMFHQGVEPSRIDRILNAQPGTAHDIVVYSWAMEKERFYGYNT